MLMCSAGAICQIPSITNIMLTKSLRELEEDGLVIHKEYPGTKRRVEYSLSEWGLRFLPTLNELYGRGKEHVEWKRAQTRLEG